MTPAELKRHVERSNEDSLFFSRNNMKFSGDTMSNYGVCSKPVLVDTWSQGDVLCWELYRKRPVKGGLQSSAYFAVDDYRLIHAKVD